MTDDDILLMVSRINAAHSMGVGEERGALGCAASAACIDTNTTLEQLDGSTDTQLSSAAPAMHSTSQQPQRRQCFARKVLLMWRAGGLTRSRPSADWRLIPLTIPCFILKAQVLAHLDVFLAPVVAEAVLEVPVDGALQAVLPGGTLHPSQGRQLLVADEVPLVVERPVLHGHDLALQKDQEAMF